MKTKWIWHQCWFVIQTVLLWSMIWNVGHAQLNIEITGVGSNQYPIVTANFVGEANAPLNVMAIVRSDLQRTGRFRLIDFGSTFPETTPPEFGRIRAQGGDAFVAGSIAALANGQFDIRFRLYDVSRGQNLGGLTFVVPPSQLRLTAHRIADYIYERLLGERGIFATRLSYVSKSSGRYRLLISGSDGQDAQVALTSTEPIISPVWSPDGGKVAYVSFEARKPTIYVHELATGQRHVISNQKGNNSAPSWSPDGKRLAVALSKDGHTQIYAVNADGSNPRRMSGSMNIDTEPQFSPDGQWIYFTSDRGGSPQIYRMSAESGESQNAAQRVTFKGHFITSPRLSPDGRTLIFISRVGGAYRLHSQDLQTGEVMALTDSSHDDSPSFAANGKYVLYATRANGQQVLAAVSIDGRNRHVLSLPAGEVKEPAWGPFMK